MVSASAKFETENASKYLTQLCKHFAHKVDVSYSEDHGECRFSCGTAIMDAGKTGLSIVATAPDREQLLETQSVVERHLLRFAFREESSGLDWQEGTHLSGDQLSEGRK